MATAEELRAPVALTDDEAMLLELKASSAACFLPTPQEYIDAIESGLEQLGLTPQEAAALQSYRNSDAGKAQREKFAPPREILDRLNEALKRGDLAM